MSGKIKTLSLLLLLSMLFFSCNREKSGKLSIRFTASVDDKSLVFNEMIYQNASGNRYAIDEVKYFISELMIITKDGKNYYSIKNNPVHYVDHGISSTLQWAAPDHFPVGEYGSLAFIFGLTEERNTSNFFVNPPESNMAWPSTLGGGYHYMQINGKWEDGGEILPLNIHTGISRLVSPDSLIRYVHNYFVVYLQDIEFEIQEKKTTEIVLNMNINQWFTNPNYPQYYDFHVYGTEIMENHIAQQILQRNGESVFSINEKKNK